MTAFPSKAMLLCLILWQAAPEAVVSPDHLRYKRSLTLPAVSPGPPATQACAVLDAQVFAHASASLKDIRVYRDQNGQLKDEVPYAATLSESLQQESDEARVLNLGSRDGRIVFDLEMPNRPYTTVVLDLGAQDFIATATVSGKSSPDSKAATGLGNFTLFDLTSQRLARSTSIPLPESNFPSLHIELALSPAPGIVSNAGALRDPGLVRSATVPPSREAQTVYTTIAQTATLTRRGRQSVATFQVPLRVPVERVSFTVAPSFKGNFSREVEVKAHAVIASKHDETDPISEDDISPRDETIAGTISRVHATEDGRELAEENLSFPAAIGSNMQHPASLEVAVGNGDDQPLPITAVALEMRQRKICFDASAGSSLVLYYGDATLDAPIYDYAKLFRPVATPLVATLGPEFANDGFHPRPESRPFTERHPELLWIGLLAVVAILAVTAIRSAKKLQ